MLNIEAPHLARRGLYENARGLGGEAALETEAIISYARTMTHTRVDWERLRRFYKQLDAIAPEVNVYGWIDVALPQPAPHKPQSIDLYGRLGAMRDWTVEGVRGAVRDAAINRAAMSMSGVFASETSAARARVDDWAAADGIAPSVADHWHGQGVLAPASIHAAEKLAHEHPSLRPGRVAWLVRHPDLAITASGFERLPPLIKKQSLPLNYNDNPVMGRRVVPGDWWIELSSPATLNTPGVEL